MYIYLPLGIGRRAAECGLGRRGEERNLWFPLLPVSGPLGPSSPLWLISGTELSAQERT